MQCDLQDDDQILTLIDQISDEYGRLDVLINNAAEYQDTSLLQMSFPEWKDAWRSVMQTNVLAPANLCWGAANLMAAQGGGSIVFVSSRGAKRGEPNAVAYGASKAALSSMSQSLAQSLGKHNIRVSAVAPGFVDTDMAKEVLEGPRGDQVRAESPFNRVGTPEDVASTVVFLASEEATWLSGAVVDCNGASYLH